MNPFIIDKNGTRKNVKNLGWLLRHWRGISLVLFDYKPNNSCDGQLRVYFGDSVQYVTDFADFSVLWSWLNRPVLRGLRFVLLRNNKETCFTIGDNEWLHIQRLAYPFFLNKVLDKPIVWRSQCCGYLPLAGSLIPNTILATCSLCGQQSNFLIEGLGMLDSLNYWQYIKEN